MISPLVENGSLRDLIADSSNPILGRYLPRTASVHLFNHHFVAQRIFQQIIGLGRGVAYLHSQKPPIIHGDLHTVSLIIVFALPMHSFSREREMS